MAPDGTLVAQVPYGEVGVAVADIDPSLADGLLARRWAPERNRQAERAAAMTPPLPAPSAAMAALPRSGIRAIMELAMERGNTLNLSFGEPDFDTPPHIVEAAGAAARAGRTRYTASRGITELREAAAASITRRAGHDVTAAQIVATVGGVQGVFSTLAALADRGDKVLVPDPSWPNYVGICTLLGLEIVRYPLPAATGFEPDLDVLKTLAAGPGTKVLITNTPSNPTGAVWSRDTVAATVDIAVRNGLYVLSDEVYDEMAFDGDHVPSAPFAPDHVVTVYSLSKTYAMTGWRIGYLARPMGWWARCRRCPRSRSRARRRPRSGRRSPRCRGRRTACARCAPRTARAATSR